MATETITVGTVKESSTTYRELEESQSALLIPAEVTSAQVQEERLPATEEPAEVWNPPRKEALPARIARGFLAFYDWLSGPPMTYRDRVKEDIAKARSEWYGRLEQAKSQ